MIHPDRIQGKVHCRYATERSTGRRVFLKFFLPESREFDNAVQKHTILAASHRHVCECVLSCALPRSDDARFCPG